MQLTATAGIRATGMSPLVVAFDGRTPEPRQVTAEDLRADKVMRDTVKVASDVMQFLRTEFGRDGLDGKGSQLKVVVHAPDPHPLLGGPVMNNAYWDGEAGRMFIGDGDGELFSPLGRAKDIVAHEVGHAILESEITMGFDGEQGALHESFGDVLGALIDPADWQIGEDAFTPAVPGDALRDMSRPEYYSHLGEVDDTTNHEPHELADIPNLAAVRAAEKIGRREMGQVWYRGFTEHLRDHAGFTAAAAATVKAAEEIHGVGSSQAAAVAAAWESVGVLQAAAAQA